MANKSPDEIREYQLALDALALKIVELRKTKKGRAEAEKLLKKLPPTKLRDLLDSYYLSVDPRQWISDDEDWRRWIFLCGRGFGKTYALTKYIIRMANLGVHMHIGIANETEQEVVKVNFKGSASGILAHQSRFNKWEFLAATNQLLAENGATITAFGGMYPDKYRGYEVSLFCIDEVAKFRFPDDCHRAALEITRAKGLHPARMVVATTPTRIPLIRRFIEEGSENPSTIRLIRGSSYDNKQNLSDTYLESLERELGNGAYFRQEIFGELVEDDEAVFSDEHISASLIEPELFDESLILKTVTAIDPSGSSKKKADETGIITACACADGNIYVLKDSSGKMNPTKWGTRAIEVNREYRGAYLVVEKNFAPGLTSVILRQIDPNISIKDVWSKNNKLSRAQPVRQLLIDGRLKFVGDRHDWKDLHNQMAAFTGTRAHERDDRIDALSLAVADLEVLIRPLANKDMASLSKYSNANLHQSRKAGSLFQPRKAPSFRSRVKRSW